MDEFLSIQSNTTTPSRAPSGVSPKLRVSRRWAVLFQTAALVLYALIVATCFHLFIVLYEERHLQKEFGGEYEDYRSRVRRWLPRLRPRLAA